MTQSEHAGGQGLLYRLYAHRLQRQIDSAKLPHHVGVMVDGNRRWAKRQNGDVSSGHRAGAAKVVQFLGWCDELGIDVVTVYLLSTGNIAGRDKAELSALFEICAGLTDEIADHDTWRIRHVGAAAELPEPLAATLRAGEQRTAEHQGMTVNLAVGYGGRREISDAVRQIIREHEDAGGTLATLAESLNESVIAEHLYTGGQPDPDLILRTSGEQRLSDFMLWQSANSEFYFAEALWPDFRRVDFLRALRDYAGRQRRYGS